MKGVNFVKTLSMTKKKVVRNFGENRRKLFQDFLSESKFAQNFCPPIFVTQIFAPQYLWQVYAYGRNIMFMKSRKSDLFNYFQGLKYQWKTRWEYFFTPRWPYKG